jgi:hypothetical protein
VRVPKDVLRPDLFCKSTFTALEFAQLAHWVQRGVPREDDTRRLTALPRLETPAGCVVVKSLFFASEEVGALGADLSFDEPFPEPEWWVQSGGLVGAVTAVTEVARCCGLVGAVTAVTEVARCSTRSIGAVEKGGGGKDEPGGLGGQSSNETDQLFNSRSPREHQPTTVDLF